MKYLSFLLLIVFLGSLLVPYSSLAAGLVPCGGCEVDLDSITGECPIGQEQPDCQICHLFVMMNNIWNWLLRIVAVVGALMLMVGGYSLLTAGGSPKQLEDGKKILTTAITGLVIIFGAYLIVESILQAVGVAKWTGLRGEIGIAETGGPAYLQDFNKNWEDDEFNGKTITITSGPGKGKSRTVTDTIAPNTINFQSWPDCSLGGDPKCPGSGSKYRIGGGAFQINCSITP